MWLNLLCLSPFQPSNKQLKTGQLWPPSGTWLKSDLRHVHCLGWKGRLHNSNYIWWGRREHCRRLSELTNRMCLYVCLACVYEQSPPPPNSIRTCIRPHLIASLPGDESRLPFSNQKVQKLFASTRHWLLSCWLGYWNKFVPNNSATEDWHFAVIMLQIAISVVWNWVIITLFWRSTSEEEPGLNVLEIM